MRLPITFLLLCLIFSSSIAQKTRWYKGNLHTHSLWSDGDDYPEMIMEWYQQKGYNFLALSDHNILAEGEKCLSLTDDDDKKAFRRYLARYGEDWVTYSEMGDTVRVCLKTLEAYRHLFEEPGKFLVLQSEEISDQFEGSPIHLNATNISALIHPQGGNSLVEVMQNNIDAVQRQRWLTGKPMLVHINHPNFHWAITAEDLIALHGEQYFEVFNGHPMVRNMGDSTHSSTEQIWDIVTTSYLQTGRLPLYGLATDDSHHYHKTGGEWSNAGRGWIQVRATSLSPEALINAMEQGDFYATSGVELESLVATRKKLKIDVRTEPGVEYTIEFIGSVGQEIGVVLERVEGPSATYRFKGNELYVRARISSDKPAKNALPELPFETAWTQPAGWQLPTSPDARN